MKILLIFVCVLISIILWKRYIEYENYVNEPYIIVYADAGLNNKLRVLLSYLYRANKENKKLKIIWISSMYCNETFKNLFKPIDNVEIIEIEDDEYDYKTWDEDNKEYIEANYYSLLKPIDSIQKEINYRKKLLNNNYIACHIRRTDAINHGPYKYHIKKDEDYISFINQYPTDLKIYIATDCRDTQKTFIDLYGDRLVYKKIEDNDNLRQTSIQDAVVDMYVCAGANYFMRSPGTFSDTITYLQSKTVILVITQNVKGNGGYWGFGDIIRGMISVYQIAKKYNYKYIIDIQLHPISKYIKYSEHEYSQLIRDNKDNIYFQSDPENYIKNSNSSVIYFNTNKNINFSIKLTDECKNYIKSVLTPTNELSEYIKSIKPKKSYNIIHYRIGDDDTVENKDTDMSEFIDNFNKNKEIDDILMSDSTRFKNQIKEISDIYLFDFEIGHLGVETDNIKIKNTLAEFFIMVGAKKIKTYSTYSWVSNFVEMVSKLYDIKIINLKIK